MQYHNNATRIRREVLIRIAQAFLDEGLAEKVDRIPLEMRPRKGDSVRCCVYKDRAILKYRCMAALGQRVEEEVDELKPLSAYAKEALERDTIAAPVLTVLDEACSACIQTCYQVTNTCRGCTARPCMVNCPKEAISMHKGQAYIDADTCVNCGKCLQVCPYHAIVYTPIPCEEACPVGAISKDEQGKEQIDYDTCIFCGNCLKACPFGAIMERSQIIDVLRALKGGKKVIALPAPSIVGQFPGSIEQIAEALQKLGFAEMVEVAAGADQTTQKEAAEFVERMEQGDKLMTTSCCPAYVRAAVKHVPEIKPFMSSTPTPMHFTAEMVKAVDAEAITVFIGPCIAKRFEAIHDNSVDFVLTFEELGALLVAADIDVAECEGIRLGQPACRQGRAFPILGGVAKAVISLVQDKVETKPHQISGLDKKALMQLRLAATKQPPGNLIEVMSCPEGCVDGPCVLGNTKKVTRQIDSFAEASPAIEAAQPADCQAD